MNFLSEVMTSQYIQSTEPGVILCLPSVSVQALELRESCVCPALPATDPRVVFTKSVRVMLEAAKNQGRGGPEGARKPPLLRSPASLLTGLPAALLAQNDLYPSSNVDRQMKSQVSFIASESAVTASVPAPSEGQGSQSVGQSTS